MVFGILTPHEIYERLRGGPGSSSLGAARDAAYLEASRELDRAKLIRKLAGKIQAGWQGAASDAAFGAAMPLAEQAIDGNRQLELAEDLLSRQSDSFHDAANSVRPVPASPPESNVLNDAIPFETDLDREITAYQVDARHNVEVFRGYDNASLYNETNMPGEYPMLDHSGAAVSVTAPADGAGGGGETEARAPLRTSPEDIASASTEPAAGQVPVRGGSVEGLAVPGTREVPGPGAAGSSIGGTTPSGTGGDGSGGRGAGSGALGGGVPGGRRTGAPGERGAGAPGGGSVGIPGERGPGGLGERGAGGRGARVPGERGARGTGGLGERGAGGLGGRGTGGPDERGTGGPGARGTGGPGARGAGGAGAVTPEETARRGGPLGRSGGPGGLGGGGLPATNRGGDGDTEHERKILFGPDPDETFGSDAATAPQVIGDDGYEGR